MTAPSLMRITLTHPEPERADPYQFKRQPQRYIAQGASEARGEAEFPWPEALELLQAFADESRDAMEKRLGELLRQFLTEALKRLDGIAGLEQGLREAEEHQRPLQLVFGFDAVELFALPWCLLPLRDGRTLGAHPWCHLHFDNAKRVTIDIEDECGGPPKDKVKSLFDPFIQVGTDRSGFGLGLAIANQAAAAHEGELRVHNLLGKGCILVLDLPTNPSPPKQEGK